ncbi:putative feruloyl esterase b protein [Botrytis fragariae]|uniref:Putative feruloyl esterase b protein n=1 Tax=Botrytis fragariae TaxID=1964551 RepID=A0A8H6AWC0_9HELO|nr:putative feruloyl esterase b protein [Botrytis fragariae]KAF5874782.1 putative feruloyl esterase b protein [Botrytis fragariae]
MPLYIPPSLRILLLTLLTSRRTEQAQTVQNIHSNYTINGQFTFPGLEIGSESEWNVLLSGPEPAPLGFQYIQDMLLDDPQWSWQNYTDSLVSLADDENPRNITADDFAAMSQYFSNRGKVLMYHGMADGLIPTGSSTYFYESVAREFAGHSSIFKTIFQTRRCLYEFTIAGFQ